MRAATMAVFLAAAAVWVHAADKDGDLTRKGFLALVERYEREKELTADQRMEAIEAFKVYQIPECARFLIKALPSERHPQVLRAMTVNLIVLGTPESVRTAVVEGLPRLGDLVQISERPDPLIRPAWTYRTREKTYPYRMLPEIYFGEIAGSFAALAPGKARDWIVAQGLGGPIEKDPLLTQFMVTVIAASEHKDRARVLDALLRRPRDGQVAAVVLDAARQARLADAQFSATAAQQLRHPDADVVLAAVMYLEKAAPDTLVKELPRLLKARCQAYERRKPTTSARMPCTCARWSRTSPWILRRARPPCWRYGSPTAMSCMPSKPGTRPRDGSSRSTRA